MKKILLFLFLIPVFAAAQKTTGGNYTYIAQRYEDFTRLFQALNLPAGDSAQHKSGQDMRSGAIYLDTLNTPTSPAGLYIYKSGVWELQADEDICQNRLIDPITVTYTGTGMRFFVSGGRYQIGCNFYYLDSATVTLADGEADPRIDAIILTASGVDTLKGVAAASPVKPQVDGDQIELTFVNIAAAATTPTIITHIIYDENTESTVTNTGTTTDPDNTSNVYRLTKSINVTDINNNDIIHFTLPAQVNVQEYDAVSGFVDLKAVMSGAANTRVRFFNGATAVSNELIIPINKNSTNWQGWSVPISNFTFSNTYADRVNIRYTNTVTTVHSGFYLDYIHLAGGFTQPGGGGTSNPMTMGALDGKPANSKGATIENDVQYLQTATDSLPGLLSPTLHEKLNNQKWEYFIRNLGTLGDSLATPVNDSTVGIKKLVAGTNVTLTDTDTTIVINSSGGGGGTDNANVGAFYRWLKPTPQEIKTFANGYGILLDSTTNTDALTATADTASPSGLVSKDRLTNQLGTKLGYTTSEIYPSVNSYNIVSTIGTTRPIELLNIGENSSPGSGLHTIPVGLAKNNWSYLQTWNMKFFNPGTGRWEQAVATYDQYATELGQEGITFHAVPTGTNFSDTWHEQLQVRASGVDGTTGLTTGTYIQHKTTDYWKFKSGTYTNDQDPWTGGTTTQDNPFIWMHSEATKGTRGNFLTLEQNSSTATGGAIYFDKSRGTYASKTTSSSGDNAGYIAWRLYDGSNYQTTARLITSAPSAATTSVAPQNILLQTSATLLANIATRLEVQSNGNIGIGTAANSADRLLHSEISDATTNSIVYPFRISHTTSGTAAIGGGVGLEMETENASGTMRVTGSVTNPMTDATNATEDADYAINLIRAGTLTEGFRVTSVGGITVNGSAGTAGQVLTSGGVGAATTWSNPVKPTLTKNATIENPTASENMGWFRTPVAITITNTHAVLVGSSTPSVTYQISFGTDITSLTNVYTAGQTVTSTTTGTAASGVNDATIPANSWIRITTSAQSGTVGQISLSITYTED